MQFIKEFIVYHLEKQLILQLNQQGIILYFRVGILFSGGLDCTILTVLTHYILNQSEPIDLLNVCFDKDHKSPDRLAAIETYNNLKKIFPNRLFRLILINKTYDEVTENRNHILELCYVYIFLYIA